MKSYIYLHRVLGTNFTIIHIRHGSTAGRIKPILLGSNQMRHPTRWSKLPPLVATSMVWMARAGQPVHQPASRSHPPKASNFSRIQPNIATSWPRPSSKRSDSSTVSHLSCKTTWLWCTFAMLVKCQSKGILSSYWTREDSEPHPHVMKGNILR